MREMGHRFSWLLEENLFKREMIVFAGGFVIFECFVVIKVWCVCGGRRGNCGALYRAILAAKKMPSFSTLFSAIPVLAIRP
jgi:hypothetical protein